MMAENFRQKLTGKSINIMYEEFFGIFAPTNQIFVLDILYNINFTFNSFHNF